MEDNVTLLQEATCNALILTDTYFWSHVADAQNLNVHGQFQVGRLVLGRWRLLMCPSVLFPCLDLLVLEGWNWQQVLEEEVQQD